MPFHFHFAFAAFLSSLILVFKNNQSIHLRNQINHKSVMANIQDPEERGTMIFAWWMACLSDAYASAYYRRKPVLDDEDYDIDFYTVDPVSPDNNDSQSVIPSPREQLEVNLCDA